MTQQESTLKEKPIKIRDNNYLLENQQEYFPLVLEMMDNIGSTDPELRDELIYVTFYYWVSNGRFSSEQLKDLLNISLDDLHLLYKLYDKDDDAVFTRTFSVLFVALVIWEHMLIITICKDNTMN